MEKVVEVADGPEEVADRSVVPAHDLLVQH